MYLWTLILLTRACYANIWYTVSDLVVPSPLYGHCIGVYNHELHIIAGDSPQDPLSFSTSIYHRTIINTTITNYTTINLNPSSISWQSLSNTMDVLFPTGFKCTGQCSTVYNEYLFIINPAFMFFDETGSLLIYNMATLSFVDTSASNHTLIWRESGICATNNGSHIFAIGSKCHNCSMAHADIQVFEINTNGAWIIAGNMTIGRYYSGCNVYNEYLYIFGGYLNHNSHTNKGDVSDYIEKCALYQNKITCYHLNDTQLHIARAQHQIIMNKDAFMFIIGGINSTHHLTEIVEIFDAKNDVMMHHEWFTYITNARDGFGAFYDAQYDIIYIAGGIDSTQTIRNDIEYLPVCLLYDDCYSHLHDITLNCGDDIHKYIRNPHHSYSFYFEITDMDRIISIYFDNCQSTIDTYVFLLMWDATLNDWDTGNLVDSQWDDTGCDGLKQESFIINHPKNGYYHLVISAHEAGEYYAEFHCKYASINTSAPTYNPSLEPTNNPSLLPTNNPSLLPTNNTSSNPTTAPSTTVTTEIPTEYHNDVTHSTVNPTLIPSEIISETMVNTSMIYVDTTNVPQITDYDRISFILSFVCETKRDLRLINWQTLVLNGLLHGFKPDLRFIVHTKVNGVLHYLQNTEDVTEIIRKTKRRLLGSQNVYYFDIECNVTMDRAYVIDTDICDATFAHDFKDGLGENIHQIQIYQLADCDTPSLLKTWNIDESEHEHSDTNEEYSVIEGLLMNNLPIVILFGLLILILCMAILVEKVRSFDNFNLKQWMLFVIYSVNSYFDIFVAVHIWFTLLQMDSLDDKWFICAGIVSICIIIIPFIKTFYDMNKFITKWQSDTAHGELLKLWLVPYRVLLYFFSFILCSTYASMAMVNTNIFGMSVFSMGLSPDLHQIFNKQRVWVVLLRNIPQIILQMVFLLVRASYLNTYGVLALFISILSIITSACNSWMTFKYNDFGTTSMLFSWRISSVTIARNASSFTNKCNILRECVSKILEINHKKERLDLLTAIQYFDTDIGGLTVYILITTKIDKNMEYFVKELQNLIQSHTLSRKIQKIWNLPTHEEVHCYRFKAVENTSVSHIQMTLRLSVAKHMKITPTDAGEEASSSDSQDGFGVNTNDRAAKHKQDFVVLNTNDDIEDENTTTQQHVHEQYEYGFSFNSTTHEELL